MNLKGWCAALICGLSVGAVCAADLPFEKIVQAASHPQEWLTYWGDYHATHYRDLNQINDSNVGQLRLQWIFQTGVPGAFETVPIVFGGVMYFTANNTSAYAVDARSGRELWRFKYTIPKDARPCCGTLNRGLAMLGGRLFMATPDAHLVAIDSRNGRLLWNTEIIPAKGIYGASMAPSLSKTKWSLACRAVKKEIAGLSMLTMPPPVSAPGDFGAFQRRVNRERNLGRRFLEARGGPRGLPVPTTLQLNTVYWGVGNPGPDLYGDVRPGDNLYSDSVVAV